MKFYRRNSLLIGLIGALIFALISFHSESYAFAAEVAQEHEEILPNYKVERLSGKNRFETMLQIALKFNSGRAQNVIFTTGYDFPDAIAAVPLAKQKNAPILLVDRTPEKSKEAFAYLQEHVNKKGNVYILGGTAVIPETFVTKLAEMGFSRENIHRVAGSNRYETSVKIAELMEHDGNEFYIASGDSFADALSASVVAATTNTVTAEKSAYLKSLGKTVEPASGGVPILLVPSKQPIPESVLEYINKADKDPLSKQSIHIIGGSAAVPDSSLIQLRQRVINLDKNGIHRIAGTNRYDTMKQVNSLEGIFDASYMNNGMGPVIPNIYLASGENFPDALTGAVLAAKEVAPLVLINESMPKETCELLSAFYNKNQKGLIKDTKIIVLGATGVISNQAVVNVDYLFNYGGSLAEKPKVTTVAGSGGLGYGDGAALESKFSFPWGIVEGIDKTFYISDSANHVIRALTPDGKVTTFTGRIQGKDQYGLSIGGFKDGALSEALFNQPKGLAIDKTGSIFVADSGNGAIRVIETNGQVRTVISGLESPTDLVVAPDGSLYVSETMNHRILKVLVDGTMTVLAGGGYELVEGSPQGAYADGVREKAQFNEPTGLALGSDGTLYVADTGNQRIRAITPEGTVTTIAGSGKDLLAGTPYIRGGYQNGAAEKALFNFPSGIAIGSDGAIYVADTYNHRIRVISPNGQVETFAGNGHHGKQNGFLRQAEFDGPTGIYVSQSGNLLIVDQFGNLIRAINK